MYSTLCNINNGKLNSTWRNLDFHVRNLNCKTNRFKNIVLCNLLSFVSMTFCKRGI